MAATLITAPQNYNFTRNPIWIVLETDQMSGVSAPYTVDVDNLRCHVEVWRDVLAGEEKLGSISGIYIRRINGSL